MHWNQKCAHPEGHHLDNQGNCHSCHAKRVPDTIVIVLDIDGDFEAAFSTHENALELIKRKRSRAWTIREVPLDTPTSLGELLKQQLSEET